MPEINEKEESESRNHDLLILKYLQDEKGNGYYTVKTFYLTFILGLLVSFIIMEISSDEYYAGQKRKFPNQGSRDAMMKWNSSAFDLSFYNLRCEVQTRKFNKDPDKVILNKVTGQIRSGKLTTILGQSGSGKSTLMQKLLGRTKSFCFKQSGDIFINGQIAWNGLESLIDKVGYVPQQDVLYAELTVYETIMFSANWRLPKSFGFKEKQALVDHILKILSLEEVKNERIGDLVTRNSGYRRSEPRPGQARLSGGERKRISIAMELVSLPRVLLMDEPTSGLDSASALLLMTVLKDISRLGVTVVVIVHQPSERIFRLSDDVILLQKGEAVFIGPHSELGTTLTKLGFSHENLASAETVLDIMAGLVYPTGLPKFDFNEKYKASLYNSEIHNQDYVEDFSWSDLLTCVNNITSQVCFNNKSGRNHPRIPVLFRTMNRIEGKVNQRLLIDKEDQPIESSWYNCGSDSVRPGFKSQFNLWFMLLIQLGFRKQVGFEIAAIVGLAIIVGFVTGYNRSWSRKPMNNVFLSLSLGLLGILGTVYNDDMDPVRRAADSGMILGAHELALLFHNLFKGWLVCHFFSMSFFTALFVKTRMFILDEYPGENKFRFFSWRKFHKYYQFAHINHLNYAVTSAAGSTLCVFADHELALCNVLAIAFLITCHVFAAFSPNENQLRRDSIVFGYDFSAFFVALSKLSYVTYYLEAIFLWDEDPSNPRGRRLTMRYYAYKEYNKTFTCHCMFGLWTVYQFLRYLMFVKKNSNEFHSMNDSPHFVQFALKLLGVHIIGWILMSLFQDIYIPFVVSLRRRPN